MVNETFLNKLKGFALVKAATVCDDAKSFFPGDEVLHKSFRDSST